MIRIISRQVIRTMAYFLIALILLYMFMASDDTWLYIIFLGLFAIKIHIISYFEMRSGEGCLASAQRITTREEIFNNQMTAIIKATCLSSLPMAAYLICCSWEVFISELLLNLIVKKNNTGGIELR